nr:unnamed protein product [Digitaria exilis]
MLPDFKNCIVPAWLRSLQKYEQSINGTGFGRPVSIKSDYAALLLQTDNTTHPSPSPKFSPRPHSPPPPAAHGEPFRPSSIPSRPALVSPVAPPRALADLCDSTLFSLPRRRIAPSNLIRRMSAQIGTAARPSHQRHSYHCLLAGGRVRAEQPCDARPDPMVSNERSSCRQRPVTASPAPLQLCGMPLSALLPSLRTAGLPMQGCNGVTLCPAAARNARGAIRLASEPAPESSD